MSSSSPALAGGNPAPLNPRGRVIFASLIGPEIPTPTK